MQVVSALSSLETAGERAHLPRSCSGLIVSFPTDPDLLIENCQAYARISAQLAATQTAVRESLVSSHAYTFAPLLSRLPQGLMIEAFPLTSDEFVWTSRLAVGERVRISNRGKHSICFHVTRVVANLQGGNWSNPYVSFESLFTFVATAAANMHKACVIVYNLTPSDDAGPMFMEAAKLYRTAAGYAPHLLRYIYNILICLVSLRGAGPHRGIIDCTLCVHRSDNRLHPSTGVLHCCRYLEYAVANVVPSLRARGGAAKYPSEVQSPVLQAIAILCLAQVRARCSLLLFGPLLTLTFLSGPALCDS